MASLPQLPRSPEENDSFKKALNLISFLYNNFDVLVIDEIPQEVHFGGRHVEYLEKGWCWAEAIQALLSGKLERFSRHIVASLERDLARLHAAGIWVLTRVASLQSASLCDVVFGFCGAMAGMELETIAVTSGADGVYRVELNRPQARNAMNFRLWKELKQVFETLAADSDCRAIVLSGRGQGFSAGLDVTDPANMPQMVADTARAGLNFINHVTVMQDAVTAVENCLKPTIAVVHGACVGAGIDLITGCDVRLCSTDANFSIREVAVGLAADVGTLARLPKIVGNDSLVRELALTARNFPADEAKAMGLVSRVLPTQEDAVKEALAMAGVIAGMSPVAVVGTKKNLNFARDHTVADALDYVRTWNACMIQTEDFGKAMAAARQKSKPAFSKL